MQRRFDDLRDRADEEPLAAVAEGEGVVVGVVLVVDDPFFRFLALVADHPAFRTDVHGDDVALARVLQARVDEHFVAVEQQVGHRVADDADHLQRAVAHVANRMEHFRREQRPVAFNACSTRGGGDVRDDPCMERLRKVVLAFARSLRTDGEAVLRWCDERRIECVPARDAGAGNRSSRGCVADR